MMKKEVGVTQFGYLKNLDFCGFDVSSEHLRQD